MTPDRMVQMANQIATFFASYPRDEAIAGVADHFLKFWEPRMRDHIIQYVDQHAAAGPDEIAAEAVPPPQLPRRGVGVICAGFSPASQQDVVSPSASIFRERSTGFQQSLFQQALPFSRIQQRNVDSVSHKR